MSITYPSTWQLIRSKWISRGASTCISTVSQPSASSLSLFVCSPKTQSFSISPAKSQSTVSATLSTWCQQACLSSVSSGEHAGSSEKLPRGQWNRVRIKPPRERTIVARLLRYIEAKREFEFSPQRRDAVDTFTGKLAATLWPIVSYLGERTGISVCERVMNTIMEILSVCISFEVHIYVWWIWVSVYDTTWYIPRWLGAEFDTHSRKPPTYAECTISQSRENQVPCRVSSIVE